MQLLKQASCKAYSMHSSALPYELPEPDPICLAKSKVSLSSLWVEAVSMLRRLCMTLYQRAALQYITQAWHMQGRISCRIVSFCAF